MGVSLLVLTVLNIILLAGLSFSIFLRVKEKKEDQKLTRGLQLLQNKLSVLQDLSDKTDEQVEKLVRLIDTKSNKLKDLISETQLAQDDIIVCIETLKKEKDSIKILKEELQVTTAKAQQTPAQGKHAILIHAAQMAHAGYSLEEIQKETQLSPAEIEMIIKVNKEQLQFATDQLPEWAQNHKALSNKEIQDFANSILNRSAEAHTRSSSEEMTPNLHSISNTSNYKSAFKNSDESMPQSFIADETPASLDIDHRPTTNAASTHTSETPSNKITRFQFPKI